LLDTTTQALEVKLDRRLTVRYRGNKDHVTRFVRPNVGLEAQYVVRPQIKGAAALKIKSGLVSVTREHAIPDRTTVERKAHVRTSIVHRVHPITFGKDCNVVVCTPHRHHPGGLQRGEFANPNRRLDRDIHVPTALAWSPLYPAFRRRSRGLDPVHVPP
jgi:hypothetical protein